MDPPGNHAPLSRRPPLRSTVLPLVASLAVQAMVSMASIFVPVLAPAGKTVEAAAALLCGLWLLSRAAPRSARPTVQP